MSEPFHVLIEDVDGEAISGSFLDRLMTKLAGASNGPWGDFRVFWPAMQRRAYERGGGELNAITSHFPNGQQWETNPQLPDHVIVIQGNNGLIVARGLKTYERAGEQE